MRGFAVGSFSVKRLQADGRSESDAVLIRLQFTCLPSGWHPRERTKALPSACFHSLIPLRVCQSIGAVMKMLNYFYVWASEINLRDWVTHHSGLRSISFVLINLLLRLA